MADTFQVQPSQRCLDVTAFFNSSTILNCPSKNLEALMAPKCFRGFTLNSVPEDRAADQMALESSHCGALWLHQTMSQTAHRQMWDRLNLYSPCPRAVRNPAYILLGTVDVSEQTLYCEHSLILTRAAGKISKSIS